jgi:hypothetical protein
VTSSSGQPKAPCVYNYSPDGGMLVDVEAARRVSSGTDAHQALEPTKLLAAQRDAGVAAVTRVSLFRDNKVSMCNL